jgi:putative copper export protein
MYVPPRVDDVPPPRPPRRYAPEPRYEREPERGGGTPWWTWLLLVLGVVLLGVIRPSFSSALWGFAFGAGLAVVATFGWAGHAATGDLHEIGLPADIAHLAAVSLWLGGLTVLALCVLPRPTPRSSRRRRPPARRCASRRSR